MGIGDESGVDLCLRKRIRNVSRDTADIQGAVGRQCSHGIGDIRRRIVRVGHFQNSRRQRAGTPVSYIEPGVGGQRRRIVDRIDSQRECAVYRCAAIFIAIINIEGR